MRPHKHAELIKAWADGAKIQYYDTIDNVWRDIDMDEHLWYETAEYRIKPEEKIPVVRWLWAAYNTNQKEFLMYPHFLSEEEVREHYLFLKQDKPIRLDWSRTEFEE